MESDTANIFLTRDQQRKLAEFRNLVSDASLDANEAMKFVVARDFDPDQALKLYQNYHYHAKKYDLENPKYFESIREQFRTRKAIPLPVTCVLVFDLSKHDPAMYSPTSFLRLAFFVSCIMINHLRVQKSGVSVVYNMKGIDHANLDCVSFFMSLHMFRSWFPIKIKEILIYSPPCCLWGILKFVFLFFGPNKPLICNGFSSSLEDRLPKCFGGHLPFNMRNLVNRQLELYLEDRRMHILGGGIAKTDQFKEDSFSDTDSLLQDRMKRLGDRIGWFKTHGTASPQPIETLPLQPIPWYSKEELYNKLKLAVRTEMARFKENGIKFRSDYPRFLF